jgi:hypothetical protein
LQGVGEEGLKARSKRKALRKLAGDVKVNVGFGTGCMAGKVALRIRKIGWIDTAIRGVMFDSRVDGARSGLGKAGISW